MYRIFLVCLIIGFSIGCSGENDAVRGSDARKIMDKVENDLEDAAGAAEERIGEALGE